MGRPKYWDPQEFARDLIDDLDLQKKNVDEKIEKQKQNLDIKILKLDSDKTKFEEKIEELQKILDNEKPHNHKEKLFQQKDNEKLKPDLVYNTTREKNDEKTHNHKEKLF